MVRVPETVIGVVRYVLSVNVKLPDIVPPAIVVLPQEKSDTRTAATISNIFMIYLFMSLIVSIKKLGDIFREQLSYLIN